MKTFSLGTMSFTFLIAMHTHAQDALPFPPTPTASKAARTMQDSVHKHRREPQRLPNGAPNIVVIMLDDTGPALPDAFGGDIHAPTLARLAKEGIAYNQFHNTAMCSPTRAALLTGRNHHRVGFGQIAELSNDWDGYSGTLPPTAAPIAKVLNYYGYSTAAFGKWHNTPANETTSMGPFDRWPVGRIVGFQYFYGFLAGESSQWEPAVVENTTRVIAPRPKGYHFTEDMTDKAIAWLRAQRAIAPNKPFFMYWTPGAAHGPHHIFKSWADKYKGKFDDGWDVMRERIFARQKALGWIPANAELTPRPATLAGWKDIPEDERPFQRRLMEVYAGYVEHTDTQAGRLVDEIDRLGIRDNTLIFYVWGDNGSSAEGQNGTISELLAQSGIATETKDHIKALKALGGLDALGGPKTDNMYHAGWAWAGSTPFQGTKLVASHFGGTRTPLVVSWPKSIKADATPRPQFHHVNDIVPTIYEVTGIRPPKTVDGVSQIPFDGTSMKYSFASAKAPGQKKSQYFEIMGSRAWYQDGWMASTVGPRIPWVAGVPKGITTWTPDKDHWELYDVRSDFSQAHDLSQTQAQKLSAMTQAFDAAAKANLVYPVGGGLWDFLHPEDAPRNPATEFHYTQDVYGIPEFAGPKVGTSNNRVTIETEIKANTSGVLYALGGFSGGVALWVDKGKLNFEYNLFEIERTLITSKQALPKGKLIIEVETRKKGTVHAGPMDITIRVNGKDLAQGLVPRSASLAFTANDSFDVGMDNYSPVSAAYFSRAPFKYNGVISKFDVLYLK